MLYLTCVAGRYCARRRFVLRPRSTQSTTPRLRWLFRISLVIVLPLIPGLCFGRVGRSRAIIAVCPLLMVYERRVLAVAKVIQLVLDV